MGLAATAFAGGVVNHVNQSSIPGLFEFLLCGSYVFMLALFWAGDRALILHAEAPDGRWHSRRMMIPDLLAFSVQALIFIAMAGVLLRNCDLYLRLMLALLGFNCIWLTLKQFHFNRIIQGDEVTCSVFRARTIQCRDTMLKWNAINGVFVMAAVAILSLDLSQALTHQMIVLASVARSFADLIICFNFYTDCVDGSFGSQGRA